MGTRGRRLDTKRTVRPDMVGATIESDPEWRSLLARWGRRLVGDTLLVARSALRPGRLEVADEKKVEPVFTELMGAHARRMDAMGLAA